MFFLRLRQLERQATLLAYLVMMNIFLWWTKLLMLAGRIKHLFRCLQKVGNFSLEIIVYIFIFFFNVLGVGELQ